MEMEKQTPKQPMAQRRNLKESQYIYFETN